jgi:hypothetical protein
MARQAAVLVLLLALSSLVWWWTHRRDGVFRAPPVGPVTDGGAALRPVPGRSATFVLITSAVCAACPQARRVLRALVDEDARLGYTEIAAEDHEELVRRLGILRTPTVLLLDADGAVRSRTSGALRPDQARAALAHLSIDQRI